MPVDLGPGSISDGPFASSSVFSTKQGGHLWWRWWHEKCFECEFRSFHYVEFCSSGGLFELCGAFYVQFCDFGFVSAFKRQQNAPVTGFIDQCDQAASLTVSYHRFLSSSWGFEVTGICQSILSLAWACAKAHFLLIMAKIFRVAILFSQIHIKFPSSTLLEAEPHRFVFQRGRRRQKHDCNCYWSACRRPAEVRRIGLIFDRGSSNSSKISNFRGVPQVMMETTIETERVTDYET